MVNNAIILLSGGLDSVTTLFYVKNNIRPDKIIAIFFDYNQRPIKEELYCTKKITKKLNIPLKVVKLPWLGKLSTALINKNQDYPKTSMEDLKNIEKERQESILWWVPCRNTIFISIALAYAESKFISEKERYDIYIGVKKEGRVPIKDGTQQFIEKMNSLSEDATYHGGYKIIAPIIDLDKDEIVKLAQELNAPLDLTFSCYIGDGLENNKPIHCGVCTNCRQIQAGFYWSGIEDPSLYKRI